jgi:hypothetical protein
MFACHAVFSRVQNDNSVMFFIYILYTATFDAPLMEVVFKENVSKGALPTAAAV